MTNRRHRIPGIPVDAERTLATALAALEDRLAKLERKGGRAGIVSSNTSAVPGEFLTIEAPATGLSVILPMATQDLRNARVTLAFRNTHPVRIVCIGGTVNGERFVINQAIGTFEAICDGLGGWAVETGVSSTGLPTTATWANVLANGEFSDGSDPTLSATDTLRFVVGAPGIDAAGDLTVVSATDMHLHAGANLHLGHVGDTVEVHIEADGAIESLTPGSISESAGTTWGAQGTTSVTLQSDSNGFAATPILATMAAGTSSITVADSGSLFAQTASVSRLIIDTDGSWNVGGSNGTTGQFLRSFGAAAPPQWATIAVSDIPGIVATTGFVSIPAGGGASTSAEPIVTYSSSGNMSAERVLTASTSVTLSTAVVGQISPQRAALTGAVAASANANSTTFAGLGNGLTGNGTATAALAARFVDNGNVLLGTGYELRGEDSADILETWSVVGSQASLSYAVNKAATYTWTGVHTHNGPSHAITASGTITALSAGNARLESSAAGVSVGAGHAVATIGAGDVVINASSGVAIKATTGLAAQTAPTGDVVLTADADVSMAGDTVRMTGATQALLRAPETTVSNAAGTGLGYLGFIGGASPSGNLTFGDVGLACDTAATPAQLVKCDGTTNLGVWPINVHGVGGNTAALSVSAGTGQITPFTYTMPQGTSRVGTTYEFAMYGNFIRGATATALNLVVNLLIQGAVVKTVSLATVTAAGTYGWTATGMFTVVSIGAGGTFLSNIDVKMVGTSTADPRYGHSGSFGTDPIDTTVNRSIALRCNMGAAVAGTSLNVANYVIKRVI